MARAKVTAKRIGKGVVTWTRFHLPPEQEWSTWSVTHADVHVGPLADAEGVLKASLRRMVENPVQAAYIIVWRTLDDLKNFKSSPACAEFLQNLPEKDDVFDSSSTSRFLTLEQMNPKLTATLDGRMTFAAFLIPQKDNSLKGTWYDSLKDAFGRFLPRGFDFLSYKGRFSWQYLTVWFSVLTEDYWVESKFGKLEESQEALQGRTIFCELRLWPLKMGVTPEDEEASATDPQAKESWDQAVAQVMPPWDPEDLELEEQLNEYRDELLEHQEIDDPESEDDGVLVPCTAWFFFFCVSWGETHIRSWRWILPPGIYGPGPPSSNIIRLPPGINIRGNLPNWPRITIGPDHRLTTESELAREEASAGGTTLAFTPGPTAGPTCPGASTACGGTICRGYWVPGPELGGYSAPTTTVGGSTSTTQQQPPPTSKPVTPLTRGPIHCFDEADVQSDDHNEYSTDFSGLRGPGDEMIGPGDETIRLRKTDSHGINYDYSCG
ncbi:hypothetical protein PG988_002801 [Apiospora saccharicola]